MGLPNLFIVTRNCLRRIKIIIPAPAIEIGVDWTREQIIDYLQNLRGQNATADLAFYAYRDMETCDWIPFLKAVIERNPVSLAMAQSMSPDAVYELLQKMDGISIYDGKRLAQPDEVANYRTGDGLEKALFLANVIRQKFPKENIEIAAAGKSVVLKGAGEYRFDSSKGLKKQIQYFICRRDCCAGLKQFLVDIGCGYESIKFGQDGRIASGVCQKNGRRAIYLLAGLAAGLALFIARISNAASYLSDAPQTCINCHVMTDAYASWQRGSHGKVAICNDCHVPHSNPVAKYAFKASDGLKHSYVFTFRLEPQVL